MTAPMTQAADPVAQAAFAGVAPSARADLLRSAVVHTVPAGAVLFEQGAPPTMQNMLLSGAVHLLGRSSGGEEVLVETVEPPDFLLPAAVVTDAPYLLRARTLEPCRLMLIPAETFRTIVLRDPALAQQVIGSLAGQFRRMVRQIKNLKLRSTTERVGCYLLNLAHGQGTPRRAVLPYEKNLVASELGMTRESFSRALAALQAEGIAVDGEIISIADPKRLAVRCGLDPLIDDPETWRGTADLGSTRRSKKAASRVRK